MSSYSYMVVPTSTAAPFNTDKGKTLSTFINYFLCTGQQKADILGYSPLPKNLVLAGFEQVARIPGHVASPSISQCNNPALNILNSAPMPNKCMKLGSDCTTSTSPDGHVTTHNNDGTTSDTDSSPGSQPGSNTSGSGPRRAGGATAAIDPLTGQPAGGDVTSADGALTTASGTPVVAGRLAQPASSTRSAGWWPRCSR